MAEAIQTAPHDAEDEIPGEFLPDNVAAASGDGDRLTDAEWFRSGEPFGSMHRNNPWLKPPAGGNGVPAMRPDGSLTERFRCPLFEAGRGAEGGGLDGTPYYDTTVARRHNYWKRFDDMPRETKGHQPGGAGTFASTASA